MASRYIFQDKFGTALKFYSRIALAVSIMLCQVRYNTGEQSTIGLPSFLSEPTNITVQEGKTARLHCSVNFVRDNQVVAWMKEDSFQTSGLEVLVSDKMDRYSIRKYTFDDRVEFHLEIRNVTFGDAGAHQCYIIEFGDHNQRRMRKSKAASITVIERWNKPKLRCFEPPDVDSDGFVTTETSVAVGCSVRDAEWSRSLELQENGISVATDSRSLKNDTAKLRKLRHRIKPNDGETLEATFTCAMYFSLRDGTVETETCTIGSLRVRKPLPPPTLPPVFYEEEENSLWVKVSEDAKFNCPPKDSKSSDGRRLAWTIYPPLSQNRYLFKYDGKELSITNVSNSDSGILVTCVIYSDQIGRKDIETVLRVGKKPTFIAQGDDPNVRKRPPSNIASTGRRGNPGKRLVVPDMNNPDWKILHAKWNGIRHETDVGLVREIDIPVDILQSFPTVQHDQETTTKSNTPSELHTTSEISSTTAATTANRFNESFVTGPPIDIGGLLPNEILRNEESKFGKKPSLFTGLILICSGALISVILLGLTLGLKCRTRVQKEIPKPDISDPIPLSLPELCMDSTYEEMHANLNKFPAHSIVAGPPGVTMLEPRYQDPSASSCNSELVFGSNQVDFTVEPFYPQEHIYGGSLPPVNSENWTIDLDQLPPPEINFHDPTLYHPEAVFSNNPIYHPSQAYRPNGDNRNNEGLSESREPDYSHELSLHNHHHHHPHHPHPQYSCECSHQDHGNKHNIDCNTPYNSSIESDPYKFEYLQSDYQHNNQKPIHIDNPALNGLSRVNSDVSHASSYSTYKQEYDPDYLPPRMASWYKGSPPPFKTPNHTPYGLYEVL
ncbi:uncharacterized protein [Amphiura filiformis]|uniref:uncharacterized protein n=1 Tax=Amphiura filiformis TaxID=82378 RepID=UPI003B217D10